MPTIEVTQEQADAFERGETIRKIEKWEPEGGDWCVASNGGVYAYSSNASSRCHGVERSTKECAESAAKSMRVFNRCLAWRDENCPDHQSITVHPTACNTTGYFGVLIPMPKEKALELQQKIRSGEVEL